MRTLWLLGLAAHASCGSSSPPPRSAPPPAEATPAAPPAAEAPPSASCDAERIAAFDPGEGTVELVDHGTRLHTRWDPADTSTARIACRVDEPDDDCRARAEREVVASRHDVRVVGASVEAASAGVEAVIEVDGAEERFEAADHEEVAARLEALHAAGRRAILISSAARREAGTAIAAVVVAPRDRRPTEERVPWGRLRWTRPSQGELAAALSRLLERIERAQLSAREVQPMPDGAVELELECR